LLCTVIAGVCLIYIGRGQNTLLSIPDLNMDVLVVVLKIQCWTVPNAQLSVQCKDARYGICSNLSILVTIPLILTFINYHISRPKRCTFFPEKCDLNSTCVLCAEGKYYFQTYKYPYPHRVTTTMKMILVAVTTIFWVSVMNKLCYGC
jgi:hypothetical protein